MMNNNKVIVMAIYKFAGYGMEVETYPIVNETDKSYVVMKRNGKSRIPKEEVGKVIHHTSDYCPYVRVFLHNATKKDAKDALAKWFEDKANDIRK